MSNSNARPPSDEPPQEAPMPIDPEQQPSPLERPQQEDPKEKPAPPEVPAPESTPEDSDYDPFDEVNFPV